jgi:ElaB/YqjD/DUF883 family membrane-anchored ribosome-binding protein
MQADDLIMDDLIIEEEHELESELADVAGTARRVATWTRERVFEHPFAALGIAVAAGFAVGRLARWH